MWESIKNALGFGTDPETVQHPALSNHKPMWEAIKHVVKKTIKGAAKWALIGGVVMAGLALLPAGVVGAAGAVLNAATLGLSGTIATALGIGGGTAVLTSAAVTGLTAGAIGGAAIGALSGIGSADDAIEESKEKAILSYDREHNRQDMEEKRSMMKAMAAQRAGLGQVNVPTVGRGSQMGGPALG